MTTYREMRQIAEMMCIDRLKQIEEDRPYRIKKGYLSWDKLTPLLSFFIETIAKHKDKMFHYKEVYGDEVMLQHNKSIALWYIHDSPVYCLSRELFKAFDNTRVLHKKSILSNFNVPISTFLLLLPENLIVDPDGNRIDYLVCHLGDKRHLERSTGSYRDVNLPEVRQEYKLNISWSTWALPKEIGWFSGLSIDDNGELVDEHHDLGMIKMSSEEQEFLRRMTNVVLQCFLTLGYRQDLISKSTTGKQKSKYDKRPTFREPRMLGENYKVIKEVKSETKGTHASPTAHWRIGHVRNVVVGKREEGKREPRWIEPVYVMGNKDK